MTTSTTTNEPANGKRRLLAVVDVLLVFVVFAVDGAWPVPDVNEAHYLTKARHFWEPTWLARDIFLSSADSHVVFFAAFGWLTKLMSFPAAAWCGRLIVWSLLAVGWRRFSFALIPRFGWAALTAAAAVALGERFQMAGEWFVGGCEAKVVAYALLFSGLADVLAGRWTRGLWQLGAATAFHVLVGGWSLVALGFVWLTMRTDRPTLRQLLPGLVGAAAVSLLGVLPALALSRGVDAETAAAANSIYVYERLAHHLDPRFMVPRFGLRHALLWVVWGVACLATMKSADDRRRMLRRFTLGTGLIGLVGLAIAYGLPAYDPRATSLLRFYWFRLADATLGIGAAFELAAAARSQTRPTMRRAATIVLVAIAALHLGITLRDRAALPFARSENLAYAGNLEAWRNVCSWIKANTPDDALFITPRPFATFKWYAERAEVGTWKDVPQDAASLVEWRRRLQELYGHDTVWLNYVPEPRLREFAARYDAAYVVTYREPRLAFPTVYSNNDFVVYAIPPRERANP